MEKLRPKMAEWLLNITYLESGQAIIQTLTKIHYTVLLQSIYFRHSLSAKQTACLSNVIWTDNIWIYVSIV